MKQFYYKLLWELKVLMRRSKYPVPKAKRFTVLTRYSPEHNHTATPSSTRLTLRKALRYLATLTDDSFLVVNSDNHDEVYLRGRAASYSMKAAYRGYEWGI